MQICLQAPVVNLARSLFLSLQLPIQIDDYHAASPRSVVLCEERYDFHFWEHFLQKYFAYSSHATLKKAYDEISYSAKQLDRWKSFLEDFPTIARQHETVVYIQQHMTKHLLATSFESQKRECIGLAMAKMETFARKYPPNNRIHLLIAGDCRLLGDITWRSHLEACLPEDISFHYAYHYRSFFPPRTIWQGVLPHVFPIGYQQRHFFWLPKSPFGYDAILFVGEITAQEQYLSAFSKPIFHLNESFSNDLLSEDLFAFYRQLRENLRL